LISEHVIAGLLDELEKIGQETLDDRAAAAMAGLGTGVGSMVGASIPGYLSGAIKSQDPVTAADIAKIRKAMDMPDPVMLTKDPMLAQHGGGANAMALDEASRKSLKLGPGQYTRSFANPEAGLGVAAHEMGHGASARTAIGRAMRRAAPVAKTVGTLGGTGMAMLGDPEGQAVKYAPLVGAAGILPHVAEELGADARALAAMGRAGYGSGRIARALGRRALGTGSHIIGTGGMAVAAPYAIGRVRKYLKEKREKGE
jgi:hypothetical protein